MGRPRKHPETTEEAEQPAEAEEPSGKTVSLTYIGPPDQMVPGLGEKLETGESYDVPVEMADGLLANENHWEK